MLAFLTGGVAKYVAYGVVAAALMGGAAYLKIQYDNGIVAGIAAKDAADVLATERADNARLVASLTSRAVQAEAQAATVATTKEAISHAQPSAFSCIRSPAGRVALGGMRHVNAGGH